MASPLVTIGILSIGDMGLGIAKLLRAHNFRVITNITGRSEATHNRARSASLDLVPTDQEFVRQSDYILSIVPPRDALSTAQRIITASQEVQSQTQSQSHDRSTSSPLYYLDLNAISPHSATEIASLFAASAPYIRLVDGGIFGWPPKLTDETWTRPRIVLSGPHDLTAAPNPSGAELASVLNIRHISDTIGPASGLKMCFASTTKGFTALAILAFTTAHRLGVLEELQAQLREFSPKTGELAERMVVNMPPKAYRWVREMEEIAETFGTDGGFEEGGDLFEAVAGVYRCVAEETVLGAEKSEARVRGLTGQDVAVAVSEGVEKRKVKTE